MTTPEPSIEEQYPYTDADLETVKPSQIHEGDLIAHAGPVGAHRYVGDPALRDAAWCGFDKAWGADKWRIEYVNRWGQELYFAQPDRLRIHRIRADRRLDRQR